MDRQAEGAGAHRDSLTDAPHADNSERLAADAVPEHAARAPPVPVARAHQLLALGEAAGDGDDQRHRHVRGVLGQHAGRVGDDDAARARRLQVDMVHTRAEIGDQLQPFACVSDQVGIDVVGDGRDQHIAIGHRSFKRGAVHLLVHAVQRCVEQLGHARHYGIGQLARYDHLGVGHPGQLASCVRHGA